MLVGVGFSLMVSPGYGGRPFTYETPTELSSVGDFDGDGRVDLVILDRELGVLRFLLQDEDGNFLPEASAPMGLEAADALAVGKLHFAGGDQVAAASVVSNRVLAMGLNKASLPVMPANDLLSPGALAVVAHPALPPGMLVGTEQNDAPAPRRLSFFANLFANSGGPLQEVPGITMPQPAPLRRGNNIQLERDGSTSAAGFIALTSEETSGFRVISGEETPFAPAKYTVEGLPPSSLWTYGFFAPLKAHPAFLFYQRGATQFTTRQAEKNEDQQYAFAEAGNYDLGKAIHLLLTIDFDNKAWLLALLDNGRTAALYEFDAAGAPRQRQQWSAPPGEAFTTAAALGKGGFLLLSGAGGRSAHWHGFEYDGSRHRLRKSGALAPLHARTRQVTVFLFDKEPFAEPDAKVLELRREGDWTADIENVVGDSWRLTTLQDGGPLEGLGNPEEEIYVFPAGVLPVINQHLRFDDRPHDLPLSIATFSAQDGAVLPVVLFDPPPGRYPEALSRVENAEDLEEEAPEAEPTGAGFTVTLRSTAGMPVYYRFSPEEVWRSYAEPLQLTTSTTIYARTVSSYPVAGIQSPVVSAQYILGGEPPPHQGPLELPDPVDANGNGLADDWEAAFNQYDPNGDPDGDGKTNLEEYLAGTDPLDPGEAPVLPAPLRPELVLHYQVVVDEGTPCLELIWDSANADATLYYSPDMENWLPIREGIEFMDGTCRALVPLDSPVASGYFRLSRE